MKTMFNELSCEKAKANNKKYVKLTYTKNGTIVLSGTDNENEKINIEELEKYL